jgi:glycosyltransferase involved in cell wall biosynthesis
MSVARKAEGGLFKQCGSPHAPSPPDPGVIRQNGFASFQRPGRELVPIVYHFFAHYRAGVNRALTGSGKYDYLFVGDVSGEAASGIEAWQPPKEARFLKVHNLLLADRVLFQSKVVRLAFRRDIKSLIYLGSAQFVTTWLSAAVARLTGKRVLFWGHGWTAPDRGLKRICRLAFYRLAHGMLLYGHHAKQIGMQMGLRPENLHVIYNSLDYPAQVARRQAVREEELTNIRKSFFGQGAGNPTLICAGRLVAMRRLDLLLDAMCLLKREGRPVNLLLVGDGPERSALGHRTESGGLAVHFHGSCYDESELARLFMASDMMVMPGRVGLAAIHSLAYGTPVLIHDDPNDQGPEFESVIPGFNGAHFAHNDGSDLARAITDWFQCAPARDQIRRRCYEVVERFYNPTAQAALIERALDGEPADDSEWEKFSADRRALALGTAGSPFTLVA